VIIVILSQSGYWLADKDYPVSVRWAVPDQAPQATLVWELSIDSILLDHGSLPMNVGDRSTDFTIKCPKVHARTTLTLRYHLVSTAGKQELAAGTLPIRAFPDNLTDGWAKLISGENTAIIDSADGLPALLTKAKVSSFDRLAEALDLQLRRPNLILVGPNRLDDSPFAQGPLIDQARAGAGVLILQQSNINRVNGNAVVHRARPANLVWQYDHPLLNGFNRDDLDSWSSELPPELSAVRILRESTVVAVASWPSDGQSRYNDTIISSQTVGRGRIVLCQLPLGSWQTDPRAILFISNALDYLCSPSEPMPAMMLVRTDVRTTRSPARFAPMVLTPAGDDR
jgi:hypothetical protein